MLKFFSRRKGQKGFTLIELLVVIAIIGILATIVLVSLNTARSKARDVRRISDLRQLALALEMYYDGDGNDAYIDSAGACVVISETSLGALTTTYMGAIPEDPGTTDYYYGADTTEQDYILRATLENDVPDGDVDTTAYGCACDDASKYYCIQP